MKAFVKGDLDGFFALGLDSLVNLLLITSLCLGLMQMSPDLFFGTIMPATAVGLVAGNMFYAWQALRLARVEKRDTVCALPYGLNLLTVIAFSLLVMLPAQQQALASGLSKDEADLLAWKAGVLACLGSGLIELAGSFVVGYLRRITPRAALLASLAGIGIFFIGVDFFYRVYVFPLVGMTTLVLALVVYYGGVKFRNGIPGGLVILALGTAMSWLLFTLGYRSPIQSFNIDLSQAGIYLPSLQLHHVFDSLHILRDYFSIIVPMGLINLLVSMQCLESAEAAGDRYQTRSSLVVNGIGTLLSAGCGSPYPTGIYIGHPGWKAIGARAGYSSLNAIFVSLVCFTGTLSIVKNTIPIEAGMAILIWIAIAMGTQAFAAVPKKHIPAVVMGLLPALAAYVALIVKHSLIGAGLGSAANPLTPAVVDTMTQFRSFFAEGVFALEQGYVFSCLIYGAATVAIIEQQFRRAAAWFLFATLLTGLGVMHSYTIIPTDVVSSLEPGWKWAIGYLSMAVLLFLVPYMTEAAESPDYDI